LALGVARSFFIRASRFTPRVRHLPWEGTAHADPLVLSKAHRKIVARWRLFSGGLALRLFEIRAAVSQAGIQIVFGLSIACTANEASFCSFFSFGGGAVL